MQTTVLPLSKTEILLPQAVLLMGATATGKTALAVALAHELNAEIISVDSALVYRGMDIGTAKPTMEERQGIPHHLIDILDPAESFSAGQFARMATDLIADITSRGKLPILVGGTMLYFNALVQGMADLPDASVEVRQRLDRKAAEIGWEGMHAWLQQVDPIAAERIHPNDPQRIQRALEVFEISGKSLTDHIEAQKQRPLPFEPISMVLETGNRAELHQKIAVRFKLMLELGLVDEVQKLFERGDLDEAMPSIRCVGYRQVWSYLKGEWDYSAMEEKGIVATRQLAKRQLTWLRREKNAIHYQAGEKELLKRIFIDLKGLLNK